MPKKQKCILCGQKRFNIALKIPNAPAYVERLLKKDEIKTDRKISLQLIKCKHCQLCQLRTDNFVEGDFYEDYQMAVSYSKQMQEYQKWLARDFVDYFDLKKGQNAFEIGCGEGMFASFLVKNGLKTIGVEPSRPFYELAKKRIKVLRQFMDKNTSLPKKHFAAFVSRQTFEHLSNPNQVLADAKLFLKPDAVGLMEVPSFLTAIRNNCLVS